MEKNGFSSRQTQPGKVTLTFPFTYLSALLPHLPSRLGPCSGGFLFEVKRSHRVPSSSVGTTQGLAGSFGPAAALLCCQFLGSTAAAAPPPSRRAPVTEESFPVPFARWAVVIFVAQKKAGRKYTIFDDLFSLCFLVGFTFSIF